MPNRIAKVHVQIRIEDKAAAHAAAIRPKRTLVFALWCAEEVGLVGSNYFAKSPSGGVKTENIVAYFNLDMVGLGERAGPDASKQKLYLTLIKDGWTKDEIYAMVGADPQRTGQRQMPPGPPRLGGNLARLSPAGP